MRGSGKRTALYMARSIHTNNIRDNQELEKLYYILSSFYWKTTCINLHINGNIGEGELG